MGIASFIKQIVEALFCDVTPLHMKRGKDPIGKHEASQRARITFSHALSFTTHRLSAELEVDVIGIFMVVVDFKGVLVKSSSWLRRGGNSSSQTFLWSLNLEFFENFAIMAFVGPLWQIGILCLCLVVVVVFSGGGCV